jgi:hypothetical protein
MFCLSLFLRSHICIRTYIYLLGLASTYEGKYVTFVFLNLA